MGENTTKEVVLVQMLRTASYAAVIKGIKNVCNFTTPITREQATRLVGDVAKANSYILISEMWKMGLVIDGLEELSSDQIRDQKNRLIMLIRSIF